MSLYLQNLLRLNKPRAQIAKHGSLDEHSPKITEPINGFKIELKEHQKTLLQACLELEDSSQKNTHFSNFSYQSNVGIIGDTVGSGRDLRNCFRSSVDCGSSMFLNLYFFLISCMCLSSSYARSRPSVVSPAISFVCLIA